MRANRYAGAAHDDGVAVFFGKIERGFPQEQDHRAVAKVFVYAGAPDFHQRGCFVGLEQIGDVEFLLGVPAGFLCHIGRDDAIGADDFAGLVVAHIEVAAVGVKLIAVQTVLAL